MREISYSQNGEYQIPDISLEETRGTIGKYGMMRKIYLKQHRPAYYSELMITGRLMEHLAETEQTACRQMERLTAAMAKEAGATEELKEHDQMAWVGLMNNIRQAVEEQILPELIYA